jgi:hypothetical protein
MTTDTEILSALLDGEPVDADRLALTLEDASARATLVDFVRLRTVARDDEPVPASVSRLRRRSAAQLLRWPAVAAALLVVFLAGWFAPRPSRGPSPSSASTELPPEPARVEKFVPGVDWHSTN